MAPLRRSGALLLLALCAWAGAARASLMAIDLGSEYLRAVLIKPTGRGSPLQIVVNEMSRRKSPALVGVAGEDRLLGEEAFSFAIRYPNTVFARTRDLLGRSAKDAFVQNMLASNLLPYELVDHAERGTVMAKVNETAAYLAEELVAGVLHYAKQITDAQAGAPIVDAVITVPAWFGIEQRQALKDAAALAGLNVLALVNSHSAAALQYGIERDFAAKEQKVIFYDMGSSSTEVALVKYSTYSAKEPGSAKPKTINQFEVLDADWDAELGANDLDLLLAHHFADKFSEKTGLGDVRKVPKAMAKLRRQVRRTKEILSANTDAPFNVEELHEGRDFSSSISRADFEAMAEKAGFWTRAAAPLKRLLERNGLKGSDVDAVEMLGGGSRVPRLQTSLSEALGGRTLDRHLDADEAIVLGGALFAANLSTSFRLRKFGMTDVAMYGVSWISEDLKGASHAEDGEAAEAEPVKAHVGPLVKNLLPAGKKLPIKRAIKFTNLTADGFSFRLEYNTSTPHGLPPGRVGGPLIAEYDVSGIKDAIKRYNHSGVTALRFEADWSGLVHLDKAECVVEVEVMEEKTIEVPAEEGDKDTEGKDGDKKDAKKDAKDAKKEEAKKDDKKGKKDAKEDDKKKDEKQEDKKDEKPKTVTKKITVPKRKMMHVALKVDGPRSSLPALSGGVLTAAQANVSAFALREAVKRDTARAKNDLESYIISTREKLEDDGVAAVTTEEQRSSFREALMDAEDWLYGDGEHEAAGGYRKKLSELKAVGNPITHRAAELAARPKAVAAAREGAELALKVAGAWPETKPWINATDAEGIVKQVQEYLTWLKEQEDAQAKKAAHEEPAFESTMVTLRWELVSRVFERLNNKRKPRPPPAAKANATATDDKATGKGGEQQQGEGGGSGGGSEGAEQPQAEGGSSEAEQQQEPGEQQQQGEGDELPPHEEL